MELSYGINQKELLNAILSSNPDDAVNYFEELPNSKRKSFVLKMMKGDIKLRIQGLQIQVEDYVEKFNRDILNRTTHGDETTLVSGISIASIGFNLCRSLYEKEDTIYVKKMYQGNAAKIAIAWIDGLIRKGVNYSDLNTIDENVTWLDKLPSPTKFDLENVAGIRLLYAEACIEAAEIEKAKTNLSKIDSQYLSEIRKIQYDTLLTRLKGIVPPLEDTSDDYIENNKNEAVEQMEQLLPKLQLLERMGLLSPTVASSLSEVKKILADPRPISIITTEKVAQHLNKIKQELSKNFNDKEKD